MSPEEKLEAVIAGMLTGSLTPVELESLLAPEGGEGLRLRTLPKGKILAHSGLPLTHLFLLLKGSFRVLNYSHEGKQVLAGTIDHPQIFGLYELVEGIPGHTATLECAVPCLVLEVNVDRALTCLKTRPDAAFGALRFLAMFTDDLLHRMGRLTMHSEREGLLLYLYASCREKALPVRLSIKKEELAEFLNLNLRTLYRRLEDLEAEGFLRRKQGKIEVDASCWARISAEVGDLIER